MPKANRSNIKAGTAFRRSRNMRSAAAASPATNPSAMAPTRRFSSTARKPQAGSRTSNRPRPLRDRLWCSRTPKAFARFCDPKGRVWNLVKQTDNPDARRLVEFEAGHCPAGRLVAWDRATGKSIEPKFEPSLGLIEDTAKQVSGPIWVRGGIPVVSADGQTYEIRNRMTLCRCGRSANKPFCDGSHAA